MKNPVTVFLSAGMALLSFQGALAGAPPEAATSVRVNASYGRVPVAFERNQGQAVEWAQYIARKGASTLLVGNDGVAVRLGGSEVRMRILATSPETALSASDLQPGKSNYLIGNDPKKWLTDVPHYGRIDYRGVYPGIDLAFYSNGGDLEYDWVLQPGASPERIKTRFEGGGQVRIDAQGDLVVSTQAGELRHHKPSVYQESGGKRKQIEGEFTLNERNEVGFRVAEYDPRLPLTIDPILAYASYLGGSRADLAGSVAADTSGSAYVLGVTNSLNFPVKNSFSSSLNVGQTCQHGYYDSTNGGYYTEEPCYDIFVTKFDPTGATLAYSTYIGGSVDEYASGIAVDSSGNAYITGGTASSNFPVLNALQPVLKGSQDAFLLKLNSSGNGLVFSTFFGGSGGEGANGLALDSTGVYITGGTPSSDFPANTTIYPFVAPSEIFVTKFRLDGSATIYSTFVCASCVPRAIDVDNSGIVYLGGEATASSNIHAVNAYQASLHGASDAFAMALNASGTSLLYSTYLGGGSFEQVRSIRVDKPTGMAVIGGSSFGPATPEFPFPTGITANRKVCPQTNGYSTPHCPGSGDAFVAILSPPSQTTIGGISHPPGDLLDSRLLGGVHMQYELSPTGYNLASLIYVSSQSSSYVRGFDLGGNPLFNASSVSGVPAFLATDRAGNLYAAVFSGSSQNTIQKYNGATGALIGAFATLPSGTTGPFGLAFDPSGNLYVSAYSSNAILKFSSTGSLIGTLATVASPRGLAFNGVGVLHVVTSSSPAHVYGFADTTTLNQTLATAAVNLTAGLTDPRGIAFDHNGNLYVSDTGTGGTAGYVEKYSASSVFQTATVFASGLNGPNQMAFDATDLMYIAESGGGDIKRFVTSTGAVDTTFAVTGIPGAAGMAVINAPDQAVPFESKVFDLAVDSNCNISGPSGVASCNIFATGYTITTDFPTVAPLANHNTNAGGEDIFIIKLQYNPYQPALFAGNQSAILFSTYFGGTGDDWAQGMARDNNNGIYVAGFTTPPLSGLSGFPSTAPISTTFQSQYGGGVYDAFIVKLLNADIKAISGTLSRTLSTAPVLLAAEGSAQPRLAGEAAPRATGASRTYNWQTGIQNQSSTTGYDADMPQATVTCPATSGVTCSVSAPTTGDVVTQQSPTTWLITRAVLTAGNTVPVLVQVQVDLTVGVGTILTPAINGSSITNDPDTTNNYATFPITVDPLVNFQVTGTAAAVNFTVDGASYPTPFSGPVVQGLHSVCAPASVTGATFTSWHDSLNSVIAATPCITVTVGVTSPYTLSATYTAVGEGITAPLPPSGPANGITNTSYTFSTGGATSNLGHPVQYFFDWGDGTNSGWLAVGTTSSAHSWTAWASYTVKVQARCSIDTAVTSIVSQSALGIGLNGISSFIYARQLYRDLLAREPDAAGLAYWQGLIDSGGTSRAQAAAAFFQSNEFSGVGLYIIKVYLAVLGRDPDFGGWHYWFSKVQDPATGGWNYWFYTPSVVLLSQFLTSQEFITTYGNLSDTDFVNRVYQNVLGRAPDSAGQQYWLGLIQAGTLSRAQVFDQFVRSVEYDNLVRSRAYGNLMYMGFLQRTADPSGLTYWTQVLTGGAPLARVVQGFITSSEYLNRLAAITP